MAGGRYKSDSGWEFSSQYYVEKGDVDMYYSQQVEKTDRYDVSMATALEIGHKEGKDGSQLKSSGKVGYQAKWWAEDGSLCTSLRSQFSTNWEILVSLKQVLTPSLSFELHGRCFASPATRKLPRRRRRCCRRRRRHARALRDRLLRAQVGLTTINTTQMSGWGSPTSI